MHSLIDTRETTRRLYANDASMYEELPQAVAFPRSEADLVALVQEARTRGWSITPRAAGTSLAGQTTGAGLIVDVSRHMNEVFGITADPPQARVQPGVIRDTLNRAAAPYGLHFAPDTATTNRCMIGGMIGNNSAGMYSVRHGTTREHVHRLRAVLSDGSIAEFGPLTPGELEEKKKTAGAEGRIYRELCDLLQTHAGVIRRCAPHPEIIRRNTGYALDRLLLMAPFTPGGPPFNLSALLCGSEGTLALTVWAEVALHPLPTGRVLLIPHFRSVEEAVAEAQSAVAAGCAAVELVDDKILLAALQNPEQARNRFFLQGHPGAVLILEWQGESLEECRQCALSYQQHLERRGAGYASPMVQDAVGIARVWDLRKAGLGMLMGLWLEKRTPEFMEDTAVRVSDLPAYVTDIRALMARHRTACVFYGHASVGELHLRPELDMTSPAGLATMQAMAEEVADLVRKYNGSLSGEHGDGRVRAPFLARVLGDDMVAVLEAVKRVWDPDGLFNPGKIVHPGPMQQPLRSPPGASLEPIATAFKWRDQHGFRHAVERCNGAGVCRKVAASGGTMCPSYHVTREERDSTRGRANLFRQLIRDRHREAFSSPELKEALDLCLSCKACKRECPASVDMARLKAEFLYGWHRLNGATRQERFFGFPEKAMERAARFRWLAHGEPIHAIGAALLRRLYGIHPSRSLPRMAAQPFHVWFAGRPRAGRADATAGPVVILTDYVMNYFEPWIGQAMVVVAEALGYRVHITPPRAAGRAALSQGFLEEAKTMWRTLVDELNIVEGRVVGAEPSEVLTLRDEALDALDEETAVTARAVAARVKLFEEFMLEQPTERLTVFEAGARPVLVHGHCHTKALVGMEPLMDALRACGYVPRDSGAGCCGLAGSFGYTTGHFELSMQIGELALLPAVRALDAEALVCAPGLSCRHQIRDGTGRRAWHPAELMARALV